MIRVSNVTKTYHTPTGTNVVLDNVSFTLERGQSIGVMGRNGAGKSTLTRLISGLEKPDSGTVERHMTVSWPLGYFGAFQSSLTGADNARFVARIYGRDIQTTLDSVEEFASLGKYFNMPLSTYSAGMRARLALGVSLAVEFDCYLIDEITGAGDHRFAERSHKALADRRANGTLLMISHDVASLKNYCETGALLDRGKLTFYDTLDELAEAYYAI